MPCLICSDVPIKRLRKIDRRIREGEGTLRSIAAKYELDVEALRAHARNCVLADETNDTALLDQSIRELRMMLNVVRDDIQCGRHLEVDEAAGYDGRSLLPQYAGLTRELREAILTRNKLRTTDETLTALVTTVINPFIRATTSICTQEAHRIREELFSMTDEKLHPRIKVFVDEMLERVADRIGSEAMEDFPAKVEAAVGTSKQARQ